MRLLAPATAALLLLALSSSAVAGGPPGLSEPNVEPAAPSHVERYGKQILLADALWLGATMVVASADDGDGDSGLTSLVGLGYFATGPIVHLKEGNRSGAVKSLAARALLPVGGMLVGAMLVAQSDEPDPNDDVLGDEFDVLIGMMLGATVGSVTAMVLDWTVFAKKTVEGRPASWAVRPDLKVNRRGATVGLVGSF